MDYSLLSITLSTLNLRTDNKKRPHIGWSVKGFEAPVVSKIINNTLKYKNYENNEFYIKHYLISN